MLKPCLKKTAFLGGGTVSTASFYGGKLYAYTVNIIWRLLEPELKALWYSLRAEISLTRTLQSVKFLWMCLKELRHDILSHFFDGPA